MQDIKVREDKMKAKRMQTPWREFVREICSWYVLSLQKNSGFISRYPISERIGKLVSFEEYEDVRNDMQPTIYNESKSFFSQLLELQQHIPTPPSTAFYAKNENSAYADAIFGVRNAYLSFTTGLDTENILYSVNVTINCKNILGSVFVNVNAENIYLSNMVERSYNIFFSRGIANSSNIRFSSNLVGCSECILCDTLENLSYCIHNKAYPKDEYLREKKKILDQKEKFMEFFMGVSHELVNYGSENVTGKSINFSKNIVDGFCSNRITNGRNLIFTYGNDRQIENMYDCMDSGNHSDNFFGVVGAGTNGDKLFCSSQIGNGQNIYYCYGLDSCSYCLGCIGLKNKSFCILNKQYTKEERYELANKIFAQMDADGTLGLFFPGGMNPFYFNDTAAYLIDDTFTKEEVEKEGYLRRDEEIKVDIPEGADIVVTSDECRVTGEEKLLSDYQGFNDKGNREINPEILKKVIKDEKGNYYRIVPMELEFLQKHGLPLPEIHRLERIKLGFKFK